MKIKHILVAITISVFSFQSVFADLVNEISVKYSVILDRYEMERSPESFQTLLTRIDTRIDDRLENSNISNIKRSLYLALKKVNAQRRIDIDQNDIVISTLRNTFYDDADDSTKSEEQVEETSSTSKTELFSTQRVLENNIRTELQQTLASQKNTEVLNAFANAWYDIYSTNSQFEFVENNDIKRIGFTKYISITQDNYKRMLLRDKISKIGTLIIYDGQNYYIPSSTINIETKNAYSRSQNLFFSGL